VLALTYRKSWW